MLTPYLGSMRRAFCSGLLLLLVLAFSCRQQEKSPYDFLLRDTYAERYVIIDTLGHRDSTDSRQLKDMILWAKRRGHKELALELSLRQYSRRLNNEQDKLYHYAHEMRDIIDQSRAIGNRYLEAQGMHELGTLYWNHLQNSDSGYQYFARAYELYKSFSNREFPGKFIMLYDFAQKFYKLEDYAIALKHLHEAYAIKSDQESIKQLGMLNLMGLCYRNLGDYDSAIHYFDEGLGTAEKYHRPRWVGILKGNIGSIYLLQQKYTAAEPLISGDAVQAADKKDRLGHANAITLMAELYYAEGRHALALQMADSSLRSVHRLSGSPNFRLLKRIYAVLGKSYAALGDFPKAYAFTDSFLRANDTLHHVFQNLLVGRTQRAADEERHLSEFASQRALNNYVRNSLIAGIALLAVIALLFINRLKIIHRQKQQAAATEQARIELELETASMQLKDFTRHLEEKNALIEQFNERKQQEDSLPEPEIMQQLRQAMILTDEQWEDFTVLFEKVHGNFFSRLRQKIPGVTPADIRFIALSRLRLSNKTMGGMLGISPSSVRMSKFRLLKKLELKDDDALDALIQSI
jgi:hypothetical protein